MISIGQHADAEDHTGRRAVIYARTNVDGTGLRLNDQVQQCRKEAEHRAITIVDVITDADVAGNMTTNRPGWRRVVDLIEANAVDLVLCTDISRITRRWEDMSTLMALHHAHDVDFLSLRTIVRYADNSGGAPDDGPASSAASS